MPDNADVNEASGVGEKDDNKSDDPGGAGAGDDKQRNGQQECHSIISKKNQESPQERHHEPFPDLGDNRHDLMKGEIFGGVDASDGVDNGGGGEQGENQDAEKVHTLEEEVRGPLRGEPGQNPILRGAAIGGVLQLVLVPADLGEEDRGYIDVEEKYKRKGEDEGEGDLGEDAAP